MTTEKTLEHHFLDWIDEHLSYGYGSGEPHTIPALKSFLSLCNEGTYGHQYDYNKLEEKLGGISTWLFINILCDARLIEYGTSPRFAWLTKEGQALRDFMLSHSDEELVLMVCNNENDGCTRSYCNCSPDGYIEKKLCHNPFWKERSK